ncbi:MAG: Lrp/AsnC family transcriptional regulator [Actinomycetota bacterium]|nr:Lrp/AsnC ligand binding domain-containing protein [Actinomycetota bacterium]
MINAVVLLKVEVHSIPETAAAIAALEKVSEVYSVAGEWDLVVVIRVKEHDELAEVITGKLDKLPGITKSTSLIAFQVFSKHDLDRMFSVGFEETTA